MVVRDTAGQVVAEVVGWENDVVRMGVVAVGLRRGRQTRWSCASEGYVHHCPMVAKPYLVRARSGRLQDVVAVERNFGKAVAGDLARAVGGAIAVVDLAKARQTVVDMGWPRDERSSGCRSCC